ncbi:MAG TPA: glycoside hydrolase family 2 TIM barrel-domain containing protein, partial [Isosphaeraceae bacterium]
MIRITLRAVGLLACGAALAAAAETPKPEHPTPDAVREHWANLNGPWQFRFDARDEGRQAGWAEPGTEGFDRTIVVPFGWESELSGIHETKGETRVGWYRRTFRVPEDFPKEDRVWLHFGAVDWRADVWVNGRHVAEHDGGYTPFATDVTDALRPGQDNVVVVRAFDPTDPSLPTGKQVGWYTPTSGIWQTVWLEARPRAHIGGFTIQTTTHSVNVVARAEGLTEGEYTLTARSDDPTVGVHQATLRVPGGQEVAPTGVSGVEFEVRDPRLWSPESPHLYDIALELKGPDGRVDRVRTYFGLRTIARGPYGDDPTERVLLNGKPVYLRTALDQSFNPQGVYTAPDDAFLRRDIELAKSFGLNGLRIHIKPDEPRRLYWADKLGLLILQDMPNTWRQNPTARAAWESTMREAVARDRNHPAIVAWVAFNETWGLANKSSEEYKSDRDTQRWVQSMVAAIRQLDPTRLVEDNSPCNYDHVEGTDLDSWHFYIDDHAAARRHIEEVVAKTEPGSNFNYCPGHEKSTEPLINSEYGAISAGGGDRDVSWGFRDLTTQLRRHPEIQGYVYTELTDIEWEHNGFANYDRSPKEFGYGAFVPGMTVADLQGPDFVGYDAPPAIVARPGETITIPVFVSHYSELKGPAKLRWGLVRPSPRDDSRPVGAQGGERSVDWKPYGVTELEPVTIRAPESPTVGAVALTLEVDGQRVAANFVNVVVRPEQPEPRVARQGERTLLVRFDPADFARRRWSAGPAQAPPGKAYGRGKGFLEYHFRLPRAVIEAGPEWVSIALEVASKAGREKVDWPERVNRQDYPQTDVRKWPSTLEVSINGHTVARRDLADDPADARGVLSHLARVEHGSYGQWVGFQMKLPEEVRAELAAGKPLVLRLAVPDDAKHPGGLCLFGAATGRIPTDPSLAIETRRPLPADLDAEGSLTIDVAAARQQPVLPAGDLSPNPAVTWAYTTSDPGPSWTR